VTIDPKNLSATATLTFSDEFNTLSLRNGTSGTWSTKFPFAPESGGTLPANGEQEWYINSTYAPTSSVKPWSVSNGVLTLAAQPASSSIQPAINGYKYTSGMINTHDSFNQQYGYFEMRADLPSGQGLWPAFWLLQTDMSWPPEIDVMEVLGHDMTTLHTASHTNQTGSHTSTGAAVKVPDMSAGYHTYGVDWQKDFITYYFDGSQVFKTPTPADMNEPMYMIANLEVGGYWPGMVDGTTPFPAEMHIDYIRAYTDKGSVVAPPTGGGSTGGGTTTPPPTGGGSTDGGSTGGGSRPVRDRADRPSRDHSSQPDDSNGGTDTPSRPHRADRPDRTHTSNDTTDGTDTSARPSRADRADRADRTHNSVQSDTSDDTSTTHGGREARSHATSGSDAATKLVGSAGSDSFDFSTRSAGTDTSDRSADHIRSSHHDGAGSTRFDVDADTAAASNDYPILLGDHMQLTGVHANAHVHSDLVH
jgi:beta-glucanase (GH16 family)